jgi:ribosomal protein L37AE/L43A
VIHARVEDNVFCTSCHSTQKMKRGIGDKLWKCPNCHVLLARDPRDWGETMQCKSVLQYIVKSAEQCEAESIAAGILLAARKAEGGSR